MRADQEPAFTVHQLKGETNLFIQPGFPVLLHLRKQDQWVRGSILTHSDDVLTVQTPEEVVSVPDVFVYPDWATFIALLRQANIAGNFITKSAVVAMNPYGERAVQALTALEAMLKDPECGICRLEHATVLVDEAGNAKWCRLEHSDYWLEMDSLRLRPSSPALLQDGLIPSRAKPEIPVSEVMIEGRVFPVERGRVTLPVYGEPRFKDVLVEDSRPDYFIYDVGKGQKISLNKQTLRL